MIIGTTDECRECEERIIYAPDATYRYVNPQWCHEVEEDVIDPETNQPTGEKHTVFKAQVMLDDHWGHQAMPKSYCWWQMTTGGRCEVAPGAHTVRTGLYACGRHERQATIEKEKKERRIQWAAQREEERALKEWEQEETKVLLREIEKALGIDYLVGNYNPAYGRDEWTQIRIKDLYDGIQNLRHA